MARPLPRRLLLGPGPSNVHPRVLRAMAQPLVGHLDPAFLALLDRVQAALRRLFGTQNELTLPLSATGSAGMEACLVNLLEPGDGVVVGVAGVFGERMAEVARRAGAQVGRGGTEAGPPRAGDGVGAAVVAGRPRVGRFVARGRSPGGWLRMG